MTIIQKIGCIAIIALAAADDSSSKEFQAVNAENSWPPGVLGICGIIVVCICGCCVANLRDNLSNAIDRRGCMRRVNDCLISQLDRMIPPSDTQGSNGEGEEETKEENEDELVSRMEEGREEEKDEEVKTDLVVAPEETAGMTTNTSPSRV